MQKQTSICHLFLVEFIFDMAFCEKIKDTDAVLIGAESFDINGDCWNTIGSYPISLVASNFKVPVYVPTEFIKFNYKSLKNIEKEIIPDNYKDSFDISKVVRPRENKLLKKINVRGNVL